MSRRSKSRELAAQMLYQVDLNPDVGAQTVRAQIAERLDDQELRDFAWRLFAGTMEWRGMLDERIQSVAENWTLARMAPTDRNVLRLGAFEILQTDTPYQVAIDEAVELARKFGTAQSPQFVNGLLDRLVPPLRRQKGSAATE
jgi:transcription antitermination protein NusB